MGFQLLKNLKDMEREYFEYALILEQIAKVSSSYGISVAVSGLPQVILQEFGTQEQKTKLDYMAWPTEACWGALLFQNLIQIRCWFHDYDSNKGRAIFIRLRDESFG